MQVRHLVSIKGDNVVTTRPEASIAEAAQLLQEKNIGAVVVVEGSGRIAGILSERDIVRGLPRFGSKLLEQKVAERMTTDVTTCSPDDRIGDVMKLMTKGRFRHLPVIENDRLIGIVSIGDVVKNRLEELESETTTLREYIAGNA